MDIKKYEKEVMDFLNNLSDEDFLKLLNESSQPEEKCWSCDGDGEFRYGGDFGENSYYKKCEICNGTGKCR